jgi:hypothetical protein
MVTKKTSLVNGRRRSAWFELRKETSGPNTGIVAGFFAWDIRKRI